MENKINNSQKFSHLPADSAGRILTDKVPTILRDATIGEVEALLLKEVKNFDNINYVYILDSRDQLTGVISIKEVFRLPKSTKVSSVMVVSPVVVRPSTDQEKVVMLSIKHNIKSVPVVDKNSVFLGVVPSDVILKILHQEGVEDALRGGGILRHDSVKSFMEASAVAHLKKRLPWLLVGLLGGLAAAVIIGFFENVLSEMIILAAFIPAVVYLADAIGSQTEIIFIRNLALNQHLKFKSYFKKEVVVSFGLALILAILSFPISLWWFKSFSASLILSIAFPMTILASALIGVILPWLFFRINLDPALPAGPFSTIIRDILSIVIYFTVAALVLNLI